MRSSIDHGLVGTVGFALLTVGNIVSTTALIWLAAAGRSVLVVLPFCVGNWGCYLLSHYLVEGVFIDRRDHGDGDEPNPSDSERDDDRSQWVRRTVASKLATVGESMPSSRGRLVLSVGGIGSMFLTFPTGIVAVSQDDLTLLFVSSTLFVGGYIVGHQGVTDKPL